MLLFARLNTLEWVILFLGPGSYVSHAGETQMALTWQLHNPLPGDVLQVLAAAGAQGYCSATNWLLEISLSSVRLV